MKTIKIVAGITWAIVCLIIIMVLFPALNPLAHSLSKLPFMKINPRYSGGEIVREYNKGSYAISIHRQVFDGLIGERKNGYVQVDWRGKIPAQINDSIDYNNDKAIDFIVKIDSTTAQTTLAPLNPKVKDIEASTKTSYGWAVRVGLKK